MIANELDKPMEEIVGEGLLSVLNFILERNTSFNKEQRSNLHDYWKVKQEHHK